MDVATWEWLTNKRLEVKLLNLVEVRKLVHTHTLTKSCSSISIRLYNLFMHDLTPEIPLLPWLTDKTVGTGR